MCTRQTSESWHRCDLVRRGRAAGAAVGCTLLRPPPPGEASPYARTKSCVGWAHVRVRGVREQETGRERERNQSAKGIVVARCDLESFSFRKVVRCLPPAEAQSTLAGRERMDATSCLAGNVRRLPPASMHHRPPMAFTFSHPFCGSRSRSMIAADAALTGGAPAIPGLELLRGTILNWT